ncbi:hypothetical protein RN001_011373 [Aquatica leii]|uniref:Uncharacterized protein n=1 Tax=Aquatica leii TaxID=1421715 RepID=A0AAN7SEZ3_9COLE|nr:hypothetical protein RN001_011373 [Aquatica leii]
MEYPTIKTKSFYGWRFLHLEEAVENLENNDRSADIVIIPPEVDGLTDEENYSDEEFPISLIPNDVPGQIKLHFLSSDEDDEYIPPSQKFHRQPQKSIRQRQKRKVASPPDWSNDNEDATTKKEEISSGEAQVDPTDPMPEFTTVEQRMLDLHEKKLHPFYKRYQNVTRRNVVILPSDCTYRYQNGPIKAKDVPTHIKYNHDLYKPPNLQEDATTKKEEISSGEGQVDATDPMPEFTTVEQRMLDLHEKKLHPFYKRYQNVTRRNVVILPSDCTYRYQNGPIKAKDVPTHIKYNHDLYKRTNIYSDFKIVEPPRSLIAKIIEIRQNQKRTMEPKHDGSTPLNTDKVKNTDKVYHTLYQNVI